MAKKLKAATQSLGVPNLLCNNADGGHFADISYYYWFCSLFCCYSFRNRTVLNSILILELLCSSITMAACIPWIFYNEANIFPDKELQWWRLLHDDDDDGDHDDEVCISQSTSNLDSI